MEFPVSAMFRLVLQMMTSPSSCVHKEIICYGREKWNKTILNYYVKYFYLDAAGFCARRLKQKISKQTFIQHHSEVHNTERKLNG